MKITLDLSENEAIVVRDALIDKSLALRTDAKDRLIRAEDFLNNPDISERRKVNYQTLRDVAETLSLKFGIH